MRRSKKLSKDLKAPIFIGGEGRSGTRLLRAILGKHPNILEIPKETYIFANTNAENSGLHEKFAADGDVENLALSVLTSISSRRDLAMQRIKKKDFADEDKKVLEDIKALEEFADIKDQYDCFDTVAAHLTLQAGKQRWLEKTPYNIYCTDNILSLYPDAKIITIYRDPRPVCASWLNKDKLKSLIGVTRTWNKSVNVMQKLSKKLGSQLYMLRYENLILDPKVELKRLCDFLGENFDEAMLAEIDLVNSHFGDSDSGLSKIPLERWKETLSKNQKILIDRATQKNRDALGYENSDARLSLFNSILYSVFYLKELVLFPLNKLLKLISFMYRRYK